MAAAVGLKLEFQLVDPAAWSALYQSKEWDLHYVGGGNYALDPGTNVSYFTCKTADPMEGYVWCNPEWDALAAQAAGETDPQKRKELYAQLEKTIHDEVVMLPAYSDNLVFGMKDNLTGFDFTGPTDSAYNSVKDWKIE